MSIKMDLSPIVSSLEIALYTIIGFFGFIGALAIIHIAGLYFAGLFGEIIVHFIYPQLAQDDAASYYEVARQVGAKLAFYPSCSALALEFIWETEKKDTSTEWTPWRLAKVLLRACMDIFLIQVTLWGIGRAVSLVWH